MHRALAETVEAFAEGAKRSTSPEDRKLAGEYLATLAPVLAAAVLGRDILGELPRIERMFGHTQLHDDAPFRDAFATWQSFRSEYEKFALAGMTVNERLVALGIADAYERACAGRDVAEVTRLLQRALVGEPSIHKIIRAL